MIVYVNVNVMRCADNEVPTADAEFNVEVLCMKGNEGMKVCPVMRTE